MQTEKECFSLEDVMLDIRFAFLTFPLRKRNEGFLFDSQSLLSLSVQKPILQVLAIL